MIQLKYNLETEDDNTRAHCCALCRHGYHDMDKGTMCARTREQVNCPNNYWPNDCIHFEVDTKSPSRYRCAEDRVFNRITKKHETKGI